MFVIKILLAFFPAKFRVFSFRVLIHHWMSSAMTHFAPRAIRRDSSGMSPSVKLKLNLVKLIEQYVYVCVWVSECWLGQGLSCQELTNDQLVTDWQGHRAESAAVSVGACLLHYCHCFLDTCGYIFFFLLNAIRGKWAAPTARKWLTGGEEKRTKWMQNLV